MRIPAPKLPRVRIGDKVKAAALLALPIAFLLRGALFGGDVFSSANTLYLSVPFAALAPPGWESNSNTLISDSPYYFIPMLDLVRQSFSHGHLPLWNPNILSGAPLLANEQSAAFSPINALLWILPLKDGLVWLAALKLWLAGFGTFLFARRLRLGFWPSIVAGTAFAFCSFNVVWLSSAQTNVSVFLPWALLAVELVLADVSVGAMLALAAVTATYLFGGHPEATMYVALATVLYFLTRLAVNYGREGGGKRLAFFAGGTLLGLGLSAIALLPFLGVLHGSMDEAVRGRNPGTVPGASLISIFFPDYWGRPTGASVTGPSNYSERTFYAGTICLVFAAALLTVRGSARRFAPLLVLALVGLLAATDATWSSEAVGDLPVIGKTVIARMHVLFGFSAAVLGAAGIDAYLRGLLTRRAVWIVLAAAAGWGVLVLAAVGPSPSQMADALVELPGGISQHTAAVLHAGAVFWWLVLIGGLALALLAAQRGWLRARVLGPMLAVIVAVDMLAFADGYTPSIPSDQFYAPVPRAVRFLRGAQGPDRVTATHDNLPSDVGMYFGVRDVRGKDHPKPKRMVKLFKAALNPNQVPTYPLGVAAVTPSNKQVLSMMGVRYLLTRRGEASPPSPAWRPAYRGDGAVIYRNQQVVPRAYVARSVRAARGGADALSKVTAASFDARRATVVESPGRSIAGLRSRGRVAFVRDDPQRVELAATLDRPGLIVLSDSYASGWKATVDGQPAKVMRANYVYRAVRVPAGRHRIEWTYRPSTFVFGAVVSGLSLLVAGVLAVLVLVRRRRKTA